MPLEDETNDCPLPVVSKKNLARVIREWNKGLPTIGEEHQTHLEQNPILWKEIHNTYDNLPKSSQPGFAMAVYLVLESLYLQASEDEVDAKLRTESPEQPDEFQADYQI